MRRSLFTAVAVLAVAIVVAVLAVRSEEAFTAAPLSHGHHRKHRAPPVRTADASALAENLRNSARTFVDHMRLFHASDTRAQKLFSTWAGAVVDTTAFPSRTVRGSFSKETGVLKLRVTDPDLSDSQLRGVLLHELAHSNGLQHDVEWRDAFIFFCDVATRELGWDVTLSQNHNCRTHAICSARQCALCGFEDQRTHVITRGRDARVRDSWGDSRGESRTVYDRALDDYVRSGRGR